MKTFKKILPAQHGHHVEPDVPDTPKYRERRLHAAVTRLAAAFEAQCDPRDPVGAITQMTDYAEQVTAVFKSTNDRLEKVEALLQKGTTLQQQADFWKRDAEEAQAETQRANVAVLRLKKWYRLRYGRDMDADMSRDERRLKSTVPLLLDTSAQAPIAVAFRYHAAICI
jgi:hypothetical protein